MTTTLTDKKLTAEALAEVIVDQCNAIEAAVVNARTQIARLADVPTEPMPTKASSATYRIENITWEPANGPQGPYERSTGDPNTNLDVKALLEDLKQHGGKMMKNGFFIWAFQNYDRAGRKVRASK